MCFLVQSLSCLSVVIIIVRKFWICEIVACFQAFYSLQYTTEECSLFLGMETYSTTEVLNQIH